MDYSPEAPFVLAASWIEGAYTRCSWQDGALRRQRRVRPRNVWRDFDDGLDLFRPLYAGGDIAARCPYRNKNAVWISLVNRAKIKLLESRMCEGICSLPDIDVKSMKLGLGLYRHMLTRENFQFARQAGATHIVAHLVDYFKGGAHSRGDNQPTGTDAGWGFAGDPDKLWTLQELLDLRHAVEEQGLVLEAIENFDPAHWYDVLLDGPRKRQHVENVKTTIRAVGKAGIPIFGYNFSIAGVSGRTHGPFARGNAVSVGMGGPVETPIPNGMAWNMIVDKDAPSGHLKPATHEQLWSRFHEFLDEVIPVAEEAGVRMALHPDDPPMPTMRGQPRLVYQPGLYQKALDLRPSRSNMLEFCLGSLAEMTEGDVYEAADRYSGQGKIAYVHFRNVTGKVPHYRETFIDDGDIDMMRVLKILRKNKFDGVLIPDHTPQMSCNAPWHAGMAYALGYMRAALQAMERNGD